MSWNFERIAGPYQGGMGGLAWNGEQMLFSVIDEGFIRSFDPSSGVISDYRKYTNRVNGIALAPSGRVLYVTNSDDRNVRAYDLDKNGAASNERVIVPHIEGIPDGIRVDENGNLYVAAANVDVYSPEGKQLGNVHLTETPSNCAFGDADFESLYITARTSIYRVRLKAKGSVQY